MLLSTSSAVSLVQEARHRLALVDAGQSIHAEGWAEPTHDGELCYTSLSEVACAWLDPGTGYPSLHAPAHAREKEVMKMPYISHLDPTRRYTQLDRQGVTGGRMHELLQSMGQSPGAGAAALERALEEQWEVPGAVTVSAGLTALQLALLAAGVQSGDVVVLPAFAPLRLLAATLSVGAIPRVVDVDAHTFSLDPTATTLALARGGEKVAAILAVHSFGQPLMLGALLGLSREYGVPIIEEATQAPGVRYVGRLAGTVAGGGGAFGCISLSGEDPLLAIGEGGVLLCSTPGEKERVLALRGEKSSLPQVPPSFQQGPSWTRMNDFNAAYLLTELDYLAGWLARKTEIAQRFSQGLAPLPVQVPPTLDGWKFGANAYPVVTRSADEREALLAHLSSRGIVCERMVSLFLPAQLPARGVEVRWEALPQAERLAGQGLALPCLAELGDDEVELVIASVQEWYHC